MRWGKDQEASTAKTNTIIMGDRDKEEPPAECQGIVRVHSTLHAKDLAPRILVEVGGSFLCGTTRMGNVAPRKFVTQSFSWLLSFLLRIMTKGIFENKKQKKIKH